MSPPDTNLDKQTRRHKGPLIGFAIIAVVVIGLMMTYSARGDDPTNGVADEVPTESAPSD